ncbi:MAG: hypothetical protein ACI9OJ_004762 [Myxococcota bacterium]
MSGPAQSRTYQAHIVLTGVRGVKTPVEVTDETVGSVRYRPAGKTRPRLILDCHIVEVLAARGKAIRTAGVATFHWSSSLRYTYRKGTKTLSQHAHGLALDIVAIDGDFGYATVRGNYEKGVTGCGENNQGPKSGAMRKLACARWIRTRRIRSRGYCDSPASPSRSGTG